MWTSLPRPLTYRGALLNRSHLGAVARSAHNQSSSSPPTKGKHVFLPMPSGLKAYHDFYMAESAKMRQQYPKLSGKLVQAVVQALWMTSDEKSNLDRAKERAKELRNSE
ncbi:hypothetical protein JCM1840_000520 [Sporobolomyces johnsonii]